MSHYDEQREQEQEYRSKRYNYQFCRLCMDIFWRNSSNDQLGGIHHKDLSKNLRINFRGIENASN